MKYIDDFLERQFPNQVGQTYVYITDKEKLKLAFKKHSSVIEYLKRCFYRFIE